MPAKAGWSPRQRTETADAREAPLPAPDVDASPPVDGAMPALKHRRTALSILCAVSALVLPAFAGKTSREGLSREPDDRRFKRLSGTGQVTGIRERE